MHVEKYIFNFVCFKDEHLKKMFRLLKTIRTFLQLMRENLTMLSEIITG